MGIDIIMVVLLILFHTLTSGYLCSKVGNQCIMYGNNKRWMMKIPLNIDKTILKIPVLKSKSPSITNSNEEPCSKLQDI